MKINFIFNVQAISSITLQSFSQFVQKIHRFLKGIHCYKNEQVGTRNCSVNYARIKKCRVPAKCKILKCSMSIDHIKGGKTCLSWRVSKYRTQTIGIETSSHATRHIRYAAAPRAGNRTSWAAGSESAPSLEARYSSPERLTELRSDIVDCLCISVFNLR